MSVMVLTKIEEQGCLCVYKREMGVHSGVLQGLGNGILKHSFVSLTHTHAHNTSLLSSCSQRLALCIFMCEREKEVETQCLSLTAKE